MEVAGKFDSNLQATIFISHQENLTKITALCLQQFALQSNSRKLTSNATDLAKSKLRAELATSSR